MSLTKKIFLKTLSYKTMSIASSLLFTYFITGSWKFAGGVAMFEAIGKITLYIIHEWLWEKDKNKHGKSKSTTLSQQHGRSYA